MSGNVLVTGSTGGSFPTTANAAIGTSMTARAFAAKLNPDGTRVLYSTYLPDTVATASAIAVEYEGNAYFAGTTTTGHAVAVKLSADGSAILYNVVPAGAGRDAALVIAARPDGTAFLAGRTSSPDFPVTANIFQTHLKGAQNIFLTELSLGGVVAVSTYLGGSGTDGAHIPANRWRQQRLRSGSHQFPGLPDNVRRLSAVGVGASLEQFRARWIRRQVYGGGWRPSLFNLRH